MSNTKLKIVKPEFKVLIIRETALESWLIDSSTFALLVGLIGLGILLDSSAMQWLGAIVGFITMLSRSSAKVQQVTFEQAISQLQELQARAKGGGA